MKILTFIVLLANIVLFIWHFLMSGQNYAEHAEVTGLEPIRLVGELKPEKNPPIEVALTQQWLHSHDNEVLAPLMGGLIESGKIESADKAMGALAPSVKDQQARQAVGKPDPVKPVITVRAGAAPEADSKVLDSKLPKDEARIASGISDARPVISNSTAAAETRKTTSTKAVDTDSQQANMCYEAGPFRSQAFYQTWRTLTGIDAKQIKQIARNVDEADGYLVYFPAAETFEESLMNFDDLKLKGVGDLLIHRSGALQGEISLGFFSSENRALLHQQALKLKGVDALIKPRYRPKKRIFAQINIAAELEENLIASKAKWADNHSEIQITVSDHCAIKTP